MWVSVPGVLGGFSPFARLQEPLKCDGLLGSVSALSLSEPAVGLRPAAAGSSPGSALTPKGSQSIANGLPDGSCDVTRIPALRADVRNVTVMVAVLPPINPRHRCWCAQVCKQCAHLAL